MYHALGSLTMVRLQTMINACMQMKRMQYACNRIFNLVGDCVYRVELY